MHCLRYKPPFDWQRLLNFLARRAIDGVESVTDNTYRRTVVVDVDGHGRRGWLQVTPDTRQPALWLELSESLQPVRDDMMARISHQFDLQADPAAVHDALGILAADCPGIRIPGAFDGFETMVRGILGQQITIAAASTLAGRVARQLGRPLDTPFAALTRTFPTAATLAQTDDDTLGGLGVVRTRIHAIRELARQCQTGQIELSPAADTQATMAALKTIRGIGDWTAHYAALRVLNWSDAFPAADYGILKALGVDKARQAREMAEQWRPYRAYAAMCLWQSLDADPAD